MTVHNADDFLFEVIVLASGNVDNAGMDFVFGSTARIVYPRTFVSPDTEEAMGSFFGSVAWVAETGNGSAA